MKYFAILTIISQLVSASCRQTTCDEKLALYQEVRKTLISYHDDIRELGLTAEFKYLDSTQDFFWTPPGFKSSIPYDSVAAIINRKL